MSPELNTSLKPTAVVPDGRAVLPIASDLASEYASWIGSRVSVKTPGYKGESDISGELLGVLKGAQGEVVLKVRATDRWSIVDENERREYVPSLHLIPQSKILSVSRAE